MKHSEYIKKPSFCLLSILESHSLKNSEWIFLFQDYFLFKLTFSLGWRKSGNATVAQLFSNLSLKNTALQRFYPLKTSHYSKCQLATPSQVIYSIQSVNRSQPRKTALQTPGQVKLYNRGRGEKHVTITWVWASAMSCPASLKNSCTKLKGLIWLTHPNADLV